MTHCLCGSGKAMADCCQPLINLEQNALSGEAVMRAIYTAHATDQLEFLTKAYHPDMQHEVDIDAARRWAQSSKWLGFELLSQETIEDKPDLIDIELVAHFRDSKGVRQQHHEVARCEQQDGCWYFKENKVPKLTAKRVEKVGRNDPCSCNSGKKYKKCCGTAA